MGVVYIQPKLNRTQCNRARGKVGGGTCSRGKQELAIKLGSRGKQELAIKLEKEETEVAPCAAYTTHGAPTRRTCWPGTRTLKG